MKFDLGVILQSLKIGKISLELLTTVLNMKPIMVKSTYIQSIIIYFSSKCYFNQLVSYSAHISSNMLEKSIFRKSANFQVQTT